MRLYRFGSDPLRPPDEEFSGKGGVLFGGRWHIRGRPAVYASASEPLALLEKLVHSRNQFSRQSYPLYIAGVPDNLVEELPAPSLPADWRAVYPPASTQKLGSAWLASRSAIGLLVPSVLVSGIDPKVKNCLLNPAHPEYEQIAIVGPVLLAVDPRFNLLAWPEHFPQEP